MDTTGSSRWMTEEDSGMWCNGEGLNFEAISYMVLTEVKGMLRKQLSARIYERILSWLKKIEDEDKRIDELLEFQRWIFDQREIRLNSDPIHIDSGKIEDLEPQVGHLSQEISSSMVAVFTPKPTDPDFMLSLLLYTDQMDVNLSQVMNKLVNSAQKDGAVRSKLTDERYSTFLSKLQSISEYIDVLRCSEPSIHYGLGKLVDDQDMSSKGKVAEARLLIEDKELLKIDAEGEAESESTASIEVEELLKIEAGSESIASIEVEDFDSYRSSWELLRRPARKFEDMTLLSPMVFTPCTPRRSPWDAIVGSTLQIYSVRVAELHRVEGADLSWPLEVYGVVAARDTVDSSRNPIFLRPRHNCQILTRQDPFLHLMGPSRAILSMDIVSIEIQLKVKGRAKSEDRELISKVCHYNGGCFGRFLVRDNHSVIELCCEQVKQSVQATVSRVRLVDHGSLPSEYGGRVSCCSVREGAIEGATDQSKQIVLLDSKDGTIPMGKHNCINLSRCVVSVELEGRLKVTIEAYPLSGTITGHVFFTPQKSNITIGTCYLGDCVVEVTVAWSLLPSSKKS